MRKLAFFILQTLLLQIFSHAQSTEGLMRWMNKEKADPVSVDKPLFRLIGSQPIDTQSRVVSRQSKSFVLNQDAARQIRNKSGRFSIPLPGPDGKTVQAQLLRQDIAMPGFKITTSSKKQIDATEILKGQFAGVIENDDQSFLAFSITPNGVYGVMNSRTATSFYQSTGGNTSDTIIQYSGAGNLAPGASLCIADDNELSRNIALLKKSPANRVGEACKIIRMRIEVTYNMFRFNDRSHELCITYAMGLFNLNAAVLRNEGVEMRLSEIFIWDQPDIYQSTTDIYSYFSAYDKYIGSNNFDVPTDIVHIITNKSVGNSAARGTILDSNLSKKPVAITTSAEHYKTYPKYSFAAHNFMHETGHLLGSPHTHACSWPNGPIDNCSVPEGLCPPGPEPVNGGTIMSYCWNMPYVSKFRFEYGEYPGALIRACVAASSKGVPCDSLACTENYVRNVRAVVSDSTIVIRWKDAGLKYKVGVKKSTNYEWSYYEVSAVDSLVFAKDRCEKTYEYSIAPYCNQINGFGLNQLYHIGDLNVPRMKFNNRQGVVCPADSSTIFIVDRPVGFMYTWYVNGVAQPPTTNAFYRPRDTGYYYTIAERDGCTYPSDTARIRYAPLQASFTPLINNLTVEFRPVNICKTTYFWDFGDGSTDTARIPKHIYTSKGIYTTSLTRKDSLGRIETKAVIINLNDVNTDSLNFSTTGYSNKIRYLDTLCRQVARFGPDSSNYPSMWPSVNYSSQSPAGIVSKTWKSGTMEMKIFPFQPYKMDGGQAQLADTGCIANYNGSNGKYVRLLYTRWGGISWIVNDIAVGNLEVGATGRLIFNQWNTIGFSFGQKGIKLMVNGELVGANTIPVSDEFFQSMYLNIGGYYQSETQYAIRFLGYAGLIDLVRRSVLEEDFSFSASLPSQGTDTTLLNAQICYGSNYRGQGTSGTYQFQDRAVNGCDSITKVYLRVAEQIQISGRTEHPVDNKNGTLKISVSGGVAPYKIAWNDGVKDITDRSVTEGKYKVTVTDSLQCVREQQFNVFNINSGQLTAKLFPNPVQSGRVYGLRLGIPENSDISVRITDNQGKTMFTDKKTIPAGIHYYELSKVLLPGVYFIRVSNDKQKPAVVKMVIY